MMKSLSLSAFLVASAVVPLSAAAQPEVRNHRKPAKNPPAAEAPARDHRAPKVDEKRDHRKPVPSERDHRKGEKPTERDHRKGEKPTVRDHRKGEKPTVRDHRGLETDIPEGAIAPKPVDHRTEERGPKDVARPTGHAVDHRGAPAVDSAGRRNEVVPARRVRPKSWRSYEMPVVNRYWPSKGAAGTSVSISGANFGPDLKVFIGATEIPGAVATPNSVVFAIPEGTTGGLILMRDTRRTLPVGRFEVAAKYDAEAERAKIRSERKKAAEAAWKRRKKDLGKNREERLERLREREQALEISREKRQNERHAEIRAKFEAAFLANPNTRAEFAIHAERLARLQRMQRLAEANDKGTLVIRIGVALADEDQRHTGRVATLRASFKTP